uniref:COMM domain containing 8 n=1 Tax=Takifugu rubripes TaxID=31033 RepID=A0A674N112_TAKRU
MLNFYKMVVDGLCGQQPPTRADYSSTWTLEEWTELNNSLISLFRLAVYNNSSDEKVVAVLSSVGNSHTDAVLSVLRARREEIHTALLNRTNSISFATLQDFDWQLKLAISSDKMASLHIPLLSLGLSVKENGILRPVAMEMDREELNMLLGSLDAANKVEITLHVEKKGCLNYQTQLFQAVHLIKNIASHLKIFVMDLKTSIYKYVHVLGRYV